MAGKGLESQLGDWYCQILIPYERSYRHSINYIQQVSSLNLMNKLPYSNNRPLTRFYSAPGKANEGRLVGLLGEGSSVSLVSGNPISAVPKSCSGHPIPRACVY